MKYFTNNLPRATLVNFFADNSEQKQLIKQLMRIGFISIALLLTTLQLLLALPVKGQKISTVEIKFELKNETLLTAFKKIEQQTIFRFVYRKRELREIPSRSIAASSYTVEQALMLLLEDTGFSYKQIDNNVLILTNNSRFYQAVKTVETDNSIVDIPIRGQVTDTKGETLPGVSIKIKGATIGATTDLDGRYTINVPDNNSILVFTYIGFTTQEVLINGRNTVNVQLEAESTSLSEVVVVGYGTQKKRDVIGSISTIKSDVFEAPSGSSNFNSLLQGQAAGISVQASSGRLGSSVDIKIRGLSSISAGTSPLWVIDGVPIITSTAIENNGSAAQSPMELINQTDIQSIEVLKDAAATAIYGSRGSNGVIIVTTKSGKAGKASVNLSYSAGISDLPYQRVHSVLDSKQWFQIRDAAKSGNGYGAYTMNDFYSKKVYATEFLTRQQAEGISTDWQKETMRQGDFQNVNFSTGGGNNSSLYFISGNYRKDNSIMTNEDL